MKQLTPDVMVEACDLIRRLRSGESRSEGEVSGIVGRLARLLPDPYFLDYTVDRVPELSPEAVVKRAFEYRPILLGPPAGWPSTSEQG